VEFSLKSFNENENSFNKNKKEITFSEEMVNVCGYWLPIKKSSSNLNE
jgi:hypothetical protein